MSERSDDKITAVGIVLRSPAFPYSEHRKAESSVESAKALNESLLLGSPSLFEALARSGGNLDDRLKLSLHKYLLRMSYRCTPFGLFSGVSSGTVSDQTKCRVKSISNYQKHTRLDNHFLNTYVEKLYSDGALRESLLWFSNNSQYGNDFGLRYVEYRLTHAQREHHLSRVEQSEYLSTVLNRAKHGATISELIQSIISGDISGEEATEFIDQLIDSKLLLSELEPAVTGAEPHEQLISVLSKYESGQKYAQELSKLISWTEEIDRAGPGAPEDIYNKVFSWIREWDDQYDTKLVLQSDFSKPVESLTLSQEVLEQLQKAIGFLARINQRLENARLKAFKEEFIKRYEDAEIPLLEVLDAESGIGYPVSSAMSGDPSPLLDGLAFGNLSAPANSQYNLNNWNKHLLHLFQQCISKGEIEIRLSNEDASLGVNTKPIRLPDSFHTMCSVLGNEGEVNKGNFRIDYKGSGGPSSANLLGRFCHVDSSIHEMTARLIEEEEALQPDVVFAEIVHLAQARIGNVLVRPSLRKYEIPILTFPSVDEEHVIPLQDIMVSVRNGKVVLRSKRLGKEIKPRNTNAHNHGNNTIPYYHFLCDLQFQDMEVNLGWNWGVLGESKFLPRVSFGKAILSKAKWILEEADLSVNEKTAEHDFFKKVSRYRASKNLPRQVVLTQSDNQLPLDLDNEMCVRILAQELKRNKRLTLEENLFHEDNLLIEGPEGKFTNEFIIPWTRKEPVKVLTKPFTKIGNVQRSFVPDSEWHYIKIYCGLKTSDTVMAEVIKPLAGELIDESIVSEWFFIRYQDPDYHLRVRFKGDGAHGGEVMTRLNKRMEPFVKAGLVWRMQSDTYNRELERYGGSNIVNSETLFYHDSVASVEILALLDGDEGDEVRWLFAIKGINDLLTDFGYSMEEKAQVMQTIRDGFASEFSATDRDSQKRLSEHFRKHRKEVEHILSPEVETDHDFAPVWDIFLKRSRETEVCIQSIKEYCELAGSLPLNNLIGSYIHMFVNRFMRSNQRLHEFVMYDFLCQYYRSALARNKKKQVKSEQVDQLIS